MNTEIIAILDRSGSMASIADDAIGGFNTFLQEQQALPGLARLTLVLFDHEVQTPYQAIPLSHVPPLTSEKFVPRGSTALRDAIGSTLAEHGARIATEAWAETVIVLILTDGHENCSREWSPEQIKAAITAREAEGWAFVFLAANQDAFATGADLGINAAFTANFAASAAGVQAAYTSMSNTTRSLRSGG